MSEIKGKIMDQYLLEHLERLLKADIFCWSSPEGELETFHDNHEYNPIYCSKMLRQALVEKTRYLPVPFLGKWEYQIYFACIPAGAKFYMIGPMNLGALNRVELHRFYRRYGVDKLAEKELKTFSFAEVLDIVETLACVLTGQSYTDEELMEKNHLLKSTVQQEVYERVVFQMKEEEEAFYHHTYQEERKLLESIKQGNAEEAVQLSRNMDYNLGRLSTKEVRHWKNVAVAAITVCTRAAIESGVPPFEAYQISDFYIQKSDKSEDVAAILVYRNHAVKELTRRVYQHRNQKFTSSHTERCKEYIRNHYREKIYQNEIAEVLGISVSYLSRLFKKETGICLQNYVIQVRLERAANLLRYSDEPISKIAEYVNFPSQSYFGKMFKAYRNMTPKQYREIYKTVEFYGTCEKLSAEPSISKIGQCC